MVATESRGVSQREGSVNAFIIYQIASEDRETSRTFLPFPAIQQVNLMIALEPLEFIRNIQFLRPNGVVILNTQPLIPKNAILNPEVVYPNIDENITTFQKLYPEMTIVAKNYSEMAVTETQKGIYANILMCREAGVCCPQIFNKVIFDQLIQDFFCL